MENMGTAKHEIHLSDRKNMMLTGVTDVPSFCEQTIVATTADGDVTILGDEMHIARLSLSEGIVQIEGNITALEYSASGPKKSMLGRLWK